MADETIIVEVILETKNQIENATRLRTAIDELKATQDALRKNGEANTVQFEANAAALRDLQTQYRQTTKDIDNTNKQIQAETGSIAANRAELARLTAEYIKAGKPTAEQTGRIKALSDRLKEQEKAIGDNRRNVGAYAEGFKSMLGAFGAAPGALGAVSSGFITLGTSVAAGTGGLSLLIPAIVSLFEIFKTNAAFADGFSFALAGVQKGLQFIIDEVVKLAGPLTKVFTEPKQALIDLGNFIQENLINRFKAFGVIARAAADGDLKKLADGFIQLSAGVENGTDKLGKFYKGVVDAGKAGFTAAKELDALQVVSAKISGEIQKTEQNIRSLTFTLKDRSKTERDRIKIAQEIARLEIQNSARAVDLAKQELAIEQQKLKGKTLSGEEEARIERLKTDVVLAEGEARNAIAQKQTRINILLQKEELRLFQQTSKEKVKTKETELEEFSRIQDEQIKELREKRQFEEESQRQFDEIFKEQQKADLLNDLEFQQFIEEEQTRFAKEESDKRKAIRQAEFEAAVGLAEALSGLAQSIALNSKNNAELQKGIAAFQIAIDSAKSIANIVELATAPTADNIATGGLAVPLKIAALSATVLANIARANAILNSASFYEGGYTGDGNPREESKSLGRKPYIYHKSEYVVPHKLLNEPVIASFIDSVVEPKRKGIAPSGMTGMFDGGFATTAVRNEVSALLQTNQFEKALSKMRPRVSVTEINAVQDKVAVLDNMSTL